jgi:hypothetical protein
MIIPSHLKVTMIILGVNIFIIGLALLFNYRSFNVTLQFFLIFLTGIVLSFVPSILLKWKQAKNKRTNSAIKLIKQTG